MIGVQCEVILVCGLVFKKTKTVWGLNWKISMTFFELS